MVSCGNPANALCLENACALGGEMHEVRCCSDSQLPGYQQRNDCAVWSESQFSSVGSGAAGCVHDANLETAQNTCLADNARLCTLAELEGSCKAGTGYGHHADMILIASRPPAATQGFRDPGLSTFIFHLKFAKTKGAKTSTKTNRQTKRLSNTLRKQCENENQRKMLPREAPEGRK